MRAFLLWVVGAALVALVCAWQAHPAQHAGQRSRSDWAHRGFKGWSCSKGVSLCNASGAHSRAEPLLDALQRPEPMHTDSSLLHVAAMHACHVCYAPEGENEGCTDQAVGRPRT